MTGTLCEFKYIKKNNFSKTFIQFHKTGNAFSLRSVHKESSPS